MARGRFWARLSAELYIQVYPDDTPVELTPRCHAISLRNFPGPVRFTERGGVAPPPSCPAKMERAFDDVIVAMQPTRLAGWRPMAARAFRTKQRTRAIEIARWLGCEFHVARAWLSASPGGQSGAVVEIRNRIFAPFHADWPAELAALDSNGQPLATWPVESRLRGLQPDEPGRRFARVTASALLPAGAATIAMRLPNPIPGGRPLRFANRSQDREPAGWMAPGPAPIDAAPRVGQPRP